MTATRWSPLSVTLLSLMCGGAASAQVVRVTGVTRVQYLDVRPLEDDSVLASEAEGGGLLQRSPDGYVVRCITGEPYCQYKRSGPTDGLMPGTQELEVSAWGLGRGVRAYGRMRASAVVAGDEFLWPRGTDHFDLMSGYIEIDRSLIRARVGRQWATGLGYNNYDGASVLVRPLTGFQVEAFGGRSLVRAINEPYPNDELLALESYAPEEGAYLMGVRLRAQARRRAAINVMYQREIRRDRLALYSERAAVDGFVRFGAASVDGALKVDWATGTVNEGLLRFQLPPLGPVVLDVYGRHHVPYFDLWTIWGAFSPVAFSEVGTSVMWRPGGTRLEVTARGAARRYHESNADQLFGDVRSDGWRVGVSAVLLAGSSWTIDSRYDAEVGFGGARSDLSAQLSRTLGRGGFAALRGAAFQQRYELRLDEPTIFALGGEGGFKPWPRTRLVGALTAYRHTGATSGPDVAWTQLRGYLQFEWTLGAEPGLRGFGGTP